MNQEQKYDYTSLPSQNDNHAIYGSEYQLRKQSSNQWRWKIAVVALLLLSVSLISWVLIEKWQPAMDQYRMSFPSSEIETDQTDILANLPLHSVKYQHFSAYSSVTGNPAQADALWDQIKAEHGVVNVDREWAERHHLPVTQEGYADPSKNNYVIDAYHQLHCLISLRKSFFKLYNNESKPLDRPAYHYDHCFDSIRQILMCSASDQLLPTWGGGRLGEGAVRKCKDWAALRDWAAAHTACDPNDKIPEHQVLCTNGTDGLLDTIV